jgi:Glycosyl transferase family 11
VDELNSGRQVVALRGGLGNQLFQLSFALFLARQGRPVKLDLSCLRRGVPAIFLVPIIGDRARQMILPVTRFMPSPTGRLDVIGRLSRKAMRPGRIVLDDSAQGSKQDSSAPPSWWFGYWQRLSYAETLIRELRTGLMTDLALSPKSETADQDRSAVARVHVRRGDYEGNAMALSTDWYRRAVDMVHEVGGRSIETEVVTNDPEWCRRNLDLGRPYKLLPTGSALEDLRSLAASDFLVISRSTFSWWAAAVSDATVVTPDPWFPATSTGGADDLLPTTWLRCPTKSI